jgi:hypothetical protein
MLRRGAPSRIVSPLIATLHPTRSPTAASGTVSFACCVHVVPARTNTYAAPRVPFASSAPTTAVSPLTDTAKPKSSLSTVSSPQSVACSVHVSPLRTNTVGLPLPESGDEPAINVSPLSARPLPTLTLSADVSVA